MADRYWVGGTANWDGTAGTKWSATSGGAGGASVPTSADNVFFDASSGSGTVTISTVNANCNNLNFSGFTGTIFSVSNTPEIYIYGNLVVSAGMTWSASSNLAFAATTSGKTITTNGKSVGNSALILFGSGGGWTLQDALTNTAPIQVANGTFTTNNYNISCGQFAPVGGTVVLGSSTITCSSLYLSGATVNAGTSTITTGVVQIPSGGPYTLYNVTINGSVLAFNQFTVATTFNNLSIVPSASYMQVELSANITVNGTFTSFGTGVQDRNVVYSNIRGTQRAINAAAVSIQDTDFRDINANGAAVPWALSGQRVGDLGNNSDITFPAAVTRYAVASGNFSNTSVWSATSGGSVGASVPLPQDTAVFDANTGAGTYTFNVPRIGALNASALGARVISLGVDIEVYKSFTLSSALTFTNNNKILSFLGDGTNTINTAGKQLYFTIFAGNYRLNANLSVQTDSYIYGGLFEANNYNLTSGRFSVQNSTTGYTSSPNLTVYMGSGTWTATGTSGWSYTASGTFTLFPETSTIEIAASVGVTYSFAGGGATYNNLLISGSTGAAAISISGNNTFTSITSTKTNAYFLRLPASGTTTVGAWNVNGSSGNIITVESSSSGTRANLTKTGGGFSVSNFISVKDINASPASTFYAVNSTNAGNNVNWTFNFPTSQGNLLAFFT
jgi:hypothetical protein